MSVVMETVKSVNEAIELRRELKPADLMVFISYIEALWNNGAYTSATAITKIQQLLKP